MAVGRQRFSAGQDRVAGDGRCRRWKWRLLGSEIVRHRLEVGVRQKLEKVVHRRIFAPPLPKRDQLIVEVAGWLAREPREIIVFGALTLIAVAWRACQNAV